LNLKVDLKKKLSFHILKEIKRMKNKLIQRCFTIVAFLAMLALSAGNAFGVANSTTVVSPYWQTDTDVYTFVAVSHPSLTGMNSEIGVVMTALTEDSTTTFGTSAFTVSQNTTSRVFIVATNHGTINSTNITGSTAVFVTGTTSSSSGSLVFTPRSALPLGDRENGSSFGSGAVDSTMLSYWGAVVVSSSNSGFAMEFIGDTHDSAFSAYTLSANPSYRAAPLGLQ
jgi:hypothetical protein